MAGTLRNLSAVLIPLASSILSLSAEEEPPQEPASTIPALEWERLGLDFRLGPTRGFLIRKGPDNLFHLGGVLVADYTGYDDRNTRDSGVRLDRAVIRAEGRFADLDWRVAPDLKGIDTKGGFDEGWIAYTPFRFLRVTVGLMEIPLTVENTIPEEELPTVRYSLPIYLSNRTDLAVRFDGEVDEGLFYYDLAATAGEGFTRFGERIRGNQISARGVLYPFRRLDYSVRPLHYEIPLLSGLFVSAAYAHTFDHDGPLEVMHPFRNKIFAVSRFEASESNFLHIGYGAEMGPFRIVHEFVRGGYDDVELPRGGEVTLDDQVTAWSLTASWMVTGENYEGRPFRLRKGGFRAPTRRPLFWADADESGFGALELAFQYANADIDRDFFNFGFTNGNLSSQEFRTISGAFNWYAIDNLRASIQVVRTIADQSPAAFGNGGRDTSMLVRLQYSF